jgi:PAS domain S-box-containing protein
MEKHLRILIAEDLPTDAELAQRTIRKIFPDTRFEVVETEEAFKEALHRFKPDLIVSDYHMPSFTGMDALQITLKEAPGIPVIIATGSINEETAVKCMKAGATDYVLKESLNRLIPAVQHALEQKAIQQERVEAQESLRINEKRYATFLNSTSDMAFLKDDKFHYLFVNEQNAKFFGIPSRDIIGKDDFSFMPEASARKCRESDRKALEKNRLVVHEEAMGDQIFETRKFPVDFPDGTRGVGGFIRNVTTQRNAEKTKEQLTRRVQAGLQAGNFAWWEMNLPSGKVIFDNLKANLLGFPPDQFKTFTDFTDLIHPDDYTKTMQAVKQVLHENGEKYEAEYRIKNSKGQYIWFRDVGSVIEKNREKKRYRLIGITEDISGRKKLEESLLRNEKEYHDIIDAMNETVWIIDNDGTLLDVNKRAMEELGYTREELLKIGLVGIDAHLQPDDIHNLVSSMKFDKTQVFETKHQTKNGKEIPVEISSTLIRFKGKIVILSVARDISERIRNLDALRKSEEKFRNIFHNHSAIKLIVDPETKRIMEANKAALRFYGWNLNEMTKKKITEINTGPPEILEKSIQNILKGKSESIETVHQKADGSIADVEVFPSLVNIEGKTYIHSVIHNITEKKQAEKQLKLLSRSVEQNPVSIVITNKEGIIEYVNPRFTTITGYTLKEAKGKNPRILNANYHPREFFENLWNTILSGHDWNGEIRNRKKDGQLYWEDAVISPIVNNEGEITNFVSVREDITEKKRMLEELVITKEKAEESDRLKSAFLANMSHEIRTPMNGILGFIDLLRTPDLQQEDINEYFDMVTISGTRLMDTINDIIEISKIEAGQAVIKWTEVNICDLLNYFYRFFQPEAEKKHIRFTWADKDKRNDIRIRSDKNKLESVIGNLLKNAFKFTSSGSVEIGCSIDNDWISMYVKDTGPGIPPEKQQAIFERFVQVDTKYTRSHEGSGLGLSIAKNYTEMLGGKIWVDSELEKGSTFYVSFPLIHSMKKESMTTPEPKAKTPPEKEGKIILIAEDDPTGYMFLHTLLVREKFKVIKASNGEEAVKRCQESPPPDLVLMDIEMPVMNGYDTTRAIKKLNPAIPVIAQTAFALQGDREKSLEAGCDGYISKPIKKDQLLRIIYENL